MSNPFDRVEPAGAVPPVSVDAPVRSTSAGGSSKKGMWPAMSASLLMTPDGAQAESSTAAVELESQQAMQPAQNPAETWWKQKRIVAIMLGDAGIFFAISLITLALWNIIVSAIGLFAGGLFYVQWFLRFRAEKAIKGFYWPGLIVGVLGTLSAVKDFVVMILKVADSPVGGSIAAPFRLIFILLNGVMGCCALWVWFVGRTCKRQLDEAAAAAAAAGGARGVIDRVGSWVSDMRSKAIATGAKAAITRSVTMQATPVV